MIRDTNNNGVIDPGEVIERSQQRGTEAQLITLSGLAAGDYFVRVFRVSGDILYSMTLSANPQRFGYAEAEPNNSLRQANEIENLNGTRFRLGGVGTTDMDMYRFTLETTSNLEVTLTELDTDADIDINVIRDANNNGVVDANEVLAPATWNRKDPGRVNLPGLAAGTYFVQIAPHTVGTFTRYNLNLTGTPEYAVDPLEPPDNTIAESRRVNVASAGKKYPGWVGVRIDPVDFYSFSLGASNDVSVALDGLRANADVELLDQNGTVIQSSANPGTAAEAINTTLSGGATYIVKVAPVGNVSTPYTLKLTVNPRLPGITTTGSETLRQASDSEANTLLQVNTFRSGNPALGSDPRFTGIDGSGWAVAVLDSGINLGHQFFSADANGDGVADRIVYSYDFADNDPNATDPEGHGTSVSSIVAAHDTSSIGADGVAPGANIIHLKVFPNSGDAEDADIEQALQWVIENVEKYNIASVNMSLGAENFNSPKVGLYGEELEDLAGLGVIIVSAAGNEFFEDGSSQGVDYPAADPNSLAIGQVYDAAIGNRTYLDGSAQQFSV